MRILLALIPISLVLLGIAMAAFAWAVRNGQFDDLESAALDVLTDEGAPAQASASASAPGSAPPASAAPAAPAGAERAAGGPHAG
jgi:cbb3-type cytochrome oxidase maturation protein